MNLNPRTVEYGSQKEILYTVKNSSEKVGGLTLDGSAFPASTLLPAGTAVGLNKTTNLAVPWVDATSGVPYLTNHDVMTGAAEEDIIVGAWAEASLQEPKLTGVNATFKTAAGARYRFY